MKLAFSGNGAGPVGEAPKLVMTELWRRSRIDPACWENLLYAQSWADELFEHHGAYPSELLAPESELVVISAYMPPTFASAMLRRHLIRRNALRKLYARAGRPIV